MITKLRIENFKSIGEDLPALDLKPLTIFAGPNSSGKSNILESIAILAQSTRLGRNIVRSLEGSLGYGEFVRYPDSSDFPLFDFISHKKDLSRRITIEIHIEDKEHQDIGYAYSYVPKNREARQIVFARGEKLVEVGLLSMGESSWTPSFLYPDDLKSHSRPEGDARNILDPTCFIPSTRTEKTTESELKKIEQTSSQAQKIVETMETVLKDVHFISALRGEVRPTVEIGGAAEPEPRLGTHGEGLIEILSLVFRRPEHEKISEKITEWAEKFGISKIKAGWWGKNFLSSDYVDPDLNTRLNIALASHGSKQILTIITQLFWSKPGSTIMIEEPEISLHPEAQILMQQMFAEAIREGKQIILTTHSSFLLLALSKVVKSDLISPDEIAIYHIEKGENGTIVNPQKPLEINKDGYITGWIPSYVRVEDQLFKEWAESTEEI